MELTNTLAQFEAALTRQAALAAGDEAVEAAVEALLEAAGPAIRQLALTLAQQAALEVDAQLPDHKVEVVLTEGDPTLTVRADEGAPRYTGEDLEARLTLRLPAGLKETIEEAARTAGDSVNSYVVESLSRSSVRRGPRTGRHITGTVET
jgi:hypothetical protein